MSNYQKREPELAKLLKRANALLKAQMRRLGRVK